MPRSTWTGLGGRDETGIGGRDAAGIGGRLGPDYAIELDVLKIAALGNF